jgi:hypothetical protein
MTDSRSPQDALRFDPTVGTVIRTPLGTGYGHWVGGHKVFYDNTSKTFAMFYRIRTPLEQGRGGSCAVAVSTDGIHFDDVWTATKDELASNSIETGHPVRDHSGEWRLYISYEFAPTREWRIDVIRGPELAQLDTQGRRTVLAPGDFGLPWIKDPWVVLRDSQYWLYSAVPGREAPQVVGNAVHAKPLDASVLSVSNDGLYFATIEYIFEGTGEDNWHGRRARLNSMFPWGNGWIATWDGGRTFFDNYEESCGLAVSPDGRQFDRVDAATPWVTSPHGCVRYVYGQRVDDTVFFYYEYTRKDLSHDLRVTAVDI